jgi:O-antigen ligase
MKRDWGENALKRFSIIVLIFFILGFLFVKNFEPIRERFSFNDTHTISERFMQFETSFEMLKKYPYGLGIGNFVAYMQNFNEQILYSWQFQPVHNFFLLAANEMGVLVGIFLFILVFVYLYKFYKNKQIFEFCFLLFLFVIANFDHYFYDLYAGQMMLAVGISELTSPQLSPLLWQ